jgi:hypothetical protein
METRNRTSAVWVLALALLVVACILPTRSLASSVGSRASTNNQQEGGQAAKPALTGKWDITVTTQDGPQNASADLTVADDGTITGTVASQYGSASISSGSLTGNQFTFKFSLNIEGTPTDVSMSGTIDGDSIKGNGSAGDAGFDFTGARAPSASPSE